MTTTNERKRRLTPRTFTALVLMAATLIWGGFLSFQALAQTQTYEQVASAVATKVGWRHDRHRPHKELSEEELNERVNRMVRHLAIDIDATDQQVAEITALVTETAQDLRGLRGEMRASRKQLQALLTAEQIDRVALEGLRAERLADIDRMSQEITDTVADVAELLTPEQRVVLAEHIENFGPMRHGGFGRPKP